MGRNSSVTGSAPTICFVVMLLLLGLACGRREAVQKTGSSATGKKATGAISTSESHGDANPGAGHRADNDRSGGRNLVAGRNPAGSSPSRSAPSTDKSGRQERLYTFDPKLLLPDEDTAAFIVQIPPSKESPTRDTVLEIPLKDKKPRYIVDIRLIVECASRETQKEVEERIDRMQQIVVDAISAKTRSNVITLGGKLQLKEELIRRMQRALKSKGIKQIHYQQFVIQDIR